MNVEAVRSLLELSDALSEVIINATPGKSVSAEEFKQLVHQRDRLTAALNTLIGAGFKATTKELERFVAQLQHLAEELARAQKTAQAVKRALDITGHVLTAVAKVVPFVV